MLRPIETRSIPPSRSLPVETKSDSFEAPYRGFAGAPDVLDAALYAGAGRGTSEIPPPPTIDRNSELESEHAFFCTTPMTGELWDQHFEGCDLARGGRRAKPSVLPRSYELWVVDAMNRMGYWGECVFNNTSAETVVLKTTCCSRASKKETTEAHTIPPGGSFLLKARGNNVSFVLCEASVDTHKGKRQVPLVLRETVQDTFALSPVSEDVFPSPMVLNEKTALDSFVLSHPDLVGKPRLLKDKDALEVPAVWHFIWLGGTLSDEDKEAIATFRVLHPDYAMVLWTDIKREYLDSAAEDIHQQISFCREQGIRLVNFEEYFGDCLGDFNTPYISMGLRHYTDANQFGAASDIMRLVILSHMGGCYADTDRTAFQNLDYLRKTHDFLALGILGEEGKEECCCNDFLMSVPGHPVLKRVAKELNLRIQRRFTERLFGARTDISRYVSRGGIASDPSFGAVITTTGPDMLYRVYIKKGTLPGELLPTVFFEG